MKPVLQNRVAPKKGNCASACIASIFELPLEQVFDGEPEEIVHNNGWFDGLREWLLVRNLMWMPTKMAPYGYSVAVGSSPRLEGIPHACVALDGNLVHDPHPDGTFFGGKEPYEFWVFYLVDASIAIPAPSPSSNLRRNLWMKD